MTSIRGLPKKHLPAPLLFLLATALYLFTLAPSITQRHFGVDGAELATAAYTLGVAHPPGYPTYLMVAKGFSLLLPWGDIAHRINVLSALTSAGATVLVYYISHLLIEGATRSTNSTSYRASIASSVAAASLAVSPLLWSQSVITEVYSLNVLFTAGITLLALQWGKNARGASWPLLLAAFLLGLGLGNHLTLAFLTLPLAYYLVLHRGRLSLGLAAGALALLGLSVYLYLPLRASQNPPVNWGDAANLEGFVWTVSATPYRNLALGLPLTDFPGRLVEWADLLVRQFNGLGLLLGLLGVWHLRVNSPPLGVFTGLLSLSSLAYSLTYYTQDAQVYLLPAFLVFSLWIGIGLYRLLEEAAGSRVLREGLPISPSLALAMAALLAVPGLNLLLNFQGVDLRDDRESFVYAQGIFQRVEPNAVIIADTEQELFSLWYYSYVVEQGRGPTILSTRLAQFDWYLRGQHERRPDVVPAGVTGDYWSRLTQIVEHNLGERPVYITTGSDFLLNQFEGREEDGLYLLVRRKN